MWPLRLGLALAIVFVVFAAPVGAQKRSKPNQPPTVTLSSPSNDATFQEPATIVVSANANDRDGSIAWIDFYAGDTRIGGDSKKPYSATWRDVKAGTYVLTATARDNRDALTTSAPVTIRVTSATTTSDTKAPTVAITAPSTGAQVSGSVTISATATDNIGVSAVTFLVDGAAIGSDTTAPFNMTWNAATASAGSHTLVAHARDAAGNVGTSASVSVSVAASSSSTAKAVFSPSPDDAMITSYVFDVFPSTADPATSRAAATQSLGKPPLVNGEYSASVAATLLSLPSGTYVATVSAVGTDKTARSTPSAPFSVAANTSISTTLSSSSTVFARVDESPATAAGPITPPGETIAAANMLWVTDASAHMVAAFDAATGDLLGTAPVGVRPSAVAVSAGTGKVYVADEGSDTISVVDRASISRVTTIALPEPFGRSPHAISESPDGSVVYVAEGGSNVVDVIDTASDRLAGRFAAAQPGSTIRAALADPTGTVLYALSGNHGAAVGTLAAIDPATGQWLWSTMFESDPGDMAIAADGRMALVSLPAKNIIRIIDLAARAVDQDIDVGRGNAPASLHMTAAGWAVATLDADTTKVALVDPHRRVTFVTLGETTALEGAASDPASRSYVTVDDARGDAVVIAVDASSARVVRRFRLPNGGMARGVTFDPR